MICPFMQIGKYPMKDLYILVKNRHEKKCIPINAGAISDRKTSIKGLKKAVEIQRPRNRDGMNSVNENERNPCRHRRTRGH